MPPSAVSTAATCKAVTSASTSPTNPAAAAAVAVAGTEAGAQAAAGRTGMGGMAGPVAAATALPEAGPTARLAVEPTVHRRPLLAATAPRHPPMAPLHRPTVPPRRQATVRLRLGIGIGIEAVMGVGMGAIEIVTEIVTETGTADRTGPTPNGATVIAAATPAHGATNGVTGACTARGSDAKEGVCSGHITRKAGENGRLLRCAQPRLALESSCTLRDS
jgi:hypothetical protein